MLSIGSLNYDKGQFQYGEWKKPNALWSVCHTSVSTTWSKFHCDIHWINYGVVATVADENDGKWDDSNERAHSEIAIRKGLKFRWSSWMPPTPSALFENDGNSFGYLDTCTYEIHFFSVIDAFI